MRISSALFVFVLALSLACGRPDKGPAASGPAPIAVKVVTLVPGPLVAASDAFGTIESRQSADLRPEAQGTVAWVGFEDGQSVAAGAVLVKLRQEAAKATLADADARLKLAGAKYDRVNSLSAKGDASRQELDEAVAARDLAQASRDLAKDGLRRTEVRAPFAGTMGRREVSIGASVGPTTSIGRIESLGDLVVDAAMPESALESLATGQNVIIRVDALPETTVEGTLDYIAPRIDADTRTVQVRAKLTTVDPRLKPGQTARLAIATRTNDEALLVPTQSVVPAAAGPSVYVIGADNKAELRPITTGFRLEDRVEVLTGLNAGDQVVVEGLLKLRPGAAVSITGGTQ